MFFCHFIILQFVCQEKASGVRGDLQRLGSGSGGVGLIGKRGGKSGSSGSLFGTGGRGCTGTLRLFLCFSFGQFPSGQSSSFGQFPSGQSPSFGQFPSGQSSSFGQFPSGQSSSVVCSCSGMLLCAAFPLPLQATAPHTQKSVNIKAKNFFFMATVCGKFSRIFPCVFQTDVL